MPAVAAASVPAVLARFDGCRTAKVKVAEAGQLLADDVARVRAVREAMGPEGRVRIDANGAWNVDEAERALHALAEFDLEYAEQPCATVDELAELRRRVKYMGIPIAADESVRKAADPLAVARAGAADLLVVKAQPLGGVRRALEIVAEAGLPAVVSSALDTSVGLSMGVALAAALPELDYDCGLGTASLFTADVVDPSLVPRDGFLAVGRVTPDAALLDAHAASAERRDVVARPPGAVLRGAATRVTDPSPTADASCRSPTERRRSRRHAVSGDPRTSPARLDRLTASDGFDDDLRDAGELLVDAQVHLLVAEPRHHRPHGRRLPDGQHEPSSLVCRNPESQCACCADVGDDLRDVAQHLLVLREVGQGERRGAQGADPDLAHQQHAEAVVGRHVEDLLRRSRTRWSA